MIRYPLFIAGLALFAQLLGAQEIKPGANLVTEGIPSIPSSLAEDVRRYTEARSAGFAGWHPQRLEMLVSTRFGNASQLHVVTMPLGMRRQLTFFDEPVSSAGYDHRDGKFLVFARDEGGSEFDQLYRYDFADGAVTLLTDGRSQNRGTNWSNRGDWLAYSSTRRNRADRDIYIIDPRDPRTDRLALEVKGGGWAVLDWSPDDRTLLVIEYISINESHLWLADAASGHKKELTPRSRKGVSYGEALFSKDGKGVFVTTDRDFEFRRLAYIDLASREIAYLTSDLNHDVGSVSVSDDGRRLVFITNEEGLSRVYMMDTAARTYRPVAGLPPGVIFGASWHRDNRHVAFTAGSARSSADVHVLDADNGTVTRWTQSELGGMVAASLPEAELIKWRSFDGREISGFLFRPPAKFTGRRPVIINIHGGPESQARPLFQGQNNYYINELGIAIIYPNVRGSSGYGKSFLLLDNGPRREDSVKDIGALLDWVEKQPDLDASRIMIMGGSYGGYMTLASAVHYNDRIRCAIDVVGISNFISFLQNTEAYRRDLRRAEYGDERDPEMRAVFERISPLNHAEKIRKPLFVVQGANDPRVPRSEALQIVETLRKHGRPVWYLEAKDEGHGFAKKNNRDFMFYASVLFVQRFLLDDAGAARRSAATN